MCNPEAVVKAVLQDSDCTQNWYMRALVDGANGSSILVSPAAEKTSRRVPDWFPISLHLRPNEQMSSGIATVLGNSDSASGELLSERLDGLAFKCRTATGTPR